MKKTLLDRLLGNVTVIATAVYRSFQSPSRNNVVSECVLTS